MPCLSRPIPRRAPLLLLMVLHGGVSCAGPAATPAPEDIFKSGGDLDAPTDIAVVDDVADATASHGPCLAAGAAPGSNLHLHIDGKSAFAGGQLLIELVDASAAGLAIFRPPAAAILYEGPLTGPPMDWFGVTPEGKWAIRAAVYGEAGQTETFLGGGVACDSAGIATPAIRSDQCTSLQLPLLTNDEADSAKDLCGGIGLAAKGVFQPMITVLTPPTQAGGAHLMSAVVSGERLWVAASEDGFVSFDFPAPPAAPAGELNNWQVHGQPVCNRLHLVGTTVFCASRRDYLGAVTFDPATFSVKSTSKVALHPGDHSEGMADQAGSLFVASHDKGLTRLEAKSPHALGQQITPKTALDAWDVTALPAQRLAVANGDHGVLVLAPGTQPSAPWQLLGQTPLAGVSAYIADDNGQLAVGALNGGLHILRVDGDGQPHIQGSFQSRGLVYGVAFHDDLVLGAAGGHLLAVQRPKAESQAVSTLMVRGLEPSYYHAMDIDRVGTDVVSSEFQAVRQLHIATDAPSGPLLDAPMHVMSPLAVVGGLITGKLTLRNAGNEPLHLQQVVFSEAPSHSGPQQVVAKGIELAPGADTTIALSITKTIKGAISHEILVLSDDPAHPNLGLAVLEVPHLRPGDALPDVAYKTATGKLVQVKATFAGKVGVLLIVAHACPVAFVALAAARRDLAPYMNNIEVIGIDPWDLPATTPETQIYDYGFPMLFSALTTQDNHGWSEVLDLHFGQPILAGPPMPVVYVVGSDGKIALAQWGYESKTVLAAVDAALSQP